MCGLPIFADGRRIAFGKCCSLSDVAAGGRLMSSLLQAYSVHVAAIAQVFGIHRSRHPHSVHGHRSERRRVQRSEWPDSEAAECARFTEPLFSPTWYG